MNNRFSLSLRTIVSICVATSFFGAFKTNWQYTNLDKDDLEENVKSILFNDGEIETRGNHEIFDVCNYLDTYCAHYYMNLRENYAKNIRGSCGYVSICALLSFYDTFLNDNIISEEYEKTTLVATEEIDYLTQISPGVLKETFNPNGQNVSFNEALQDVVYESDTFLQCHLIVEGALNNIVTIKTDKPQNEFGLSHSEIYNLLNYYLLNDACLNNSSFELINVTSPSMATQYISQGFPVIGNIGYYDDEINKYHSCILYDKNEDGDIFANFFRGYDYHINIYDLTLISFAGIVLIPKNIHHIHSDNYVFSNQNTSCPCHREDHPCNNNIILTYGSNYYKNISPQLIITDYTNLNPSFYSVSFLNVNNVETNYSVNIYFPSLYAFMDYYSWIAVQSVSGNIVALIKRCYIINNQTLTFECKKQIDAPPRESTERVNLLDEDFNYPQSYNLTEIISDVIVDNVWCRTKRLRCGYIENQAIVLSPRKENCGLAYLELSFITVPVYSIEFHLAMWGNNEYLSSVDSTAVFQTKIQANSQWVTHLDILNDAYIPTKNEYYKTFRYYFDTPISYCRFYVQTTPFGTWNKGRICIHDILISDTEVNKYAN